MQWVSNASLPEIIEGRDHELSLEEFTALCDPRLQGCVQGALCLVQEITPGRIYPDTARRVFVLIGPDLHRYALKYGSLHNALHWYIRGMEATGEGQESSARIARTVAGMQLLRAWLGLNSTRPGTVEGVIPTGKVREELLAEAETRLEIGFSEFLF